MAGSHCGHCLLCCTCGMATHSQDTAWPPHTLTPRTEPKPSPQEPVTTAGGRTHRVCQLWPWRGPTTRQHGLRMAGGGREAATAVEGQARPNGPEAWGLAAGTRTRVVGRPQLTIPVGQR